jgi:hypothetical protein
MLMFSKPSGVSLKPYSSEESDLGALGALNCFMVFDRDWYESERDRPRIPVTVAVAWLLIH